jgi:hypothetical protein
MSCTVSIPVVVDDRGSVDWHIYQLPTDISAATYAMRACGVVSVPIEDESDATLRRLHVSGRIDAVAWHVGPHVAGQPDPLAPPQPRAVDADDALPF